MRKPNLAQVRLALASHGASGPLAPEPQQRWAAVSAIVHEGDRAELEILLIRRAAQDSDPWSGHMAFPGGRMEATDRDLVQTATRETFEEVGLDLNRQGELLGRLEPVQAVARGKRVNMLIVPYVFAVEERPHLEKSGEVEETIWIPMQALLSGELASSLNYEHAGLLLNLPAYEFQGRVVWGLTYEMLSQLLEVVRAELLY